MQQVVGRSKKVSAQRETVALCQPFCYGLKVGGRADGASAEDEALKPHVQEGHMFAILNGPCMAAEGHVSPPSAGVFRWKPMGCVNSQVTKDCRRW